jgi:hypothetical protein
MDMPVHVRKYWIQKYNADNTETNNYDGTKTNVINGGNINTYASLEQMKMKNTTNRG